MPRNRVAAMKFFVDLNLRPPLKNHHQTVKMIEKSVELGYNAIGIAFPVDVEQKEVQIIQETCKSIGVDMVTRTELTPKTPKDLLRDLRSFRRKFEVIAVLCYSKDVARQAAKDRRVDLISFPSINPRKRFFDFAEAELASNSLACFEINLAPLLLLESYERARLLSYLRRETLIAKKFGVPIVLSSGANEPYLLRKPQDYAFLTYLFGLDFNAAEKAISENPRAIIERNKKKASANYVAPGVYLIKKGKDCLRHLG
ncbi:MAG: RNase P subunit p30 family protein [Candidatus Bathyarchaeia archaeon]